MGAAIVAKHSSLVRAKFGTVARPARTNGSLLTNNPEMRQVGWDWDGAGPPPTVFWVGESNEDGYSPIGPHGPFPAYGPALPVTTRAISLIADPLTAGRLRTRVYTPEQPVGTLVPEWVRWLVDPQLLRMDARVGPSMIPAPNRLSRSIFWRQFISTAIGWGKSFIYFLEAFDGQPLPGTLRLINPGLVEVNDNGRWQIDDYEFDDDGRRNGGRLVCLHSPLHENGVFLDHPEAFRLPRSIEKYTAGTFRSGIPSGFLKTSNPNFTEPQAVQLRDQWLKHHGGDRRSIAVLNSTTDFQPIAFSPVDAALAEVKRLSIADVAFAFNISPEVLGVTLGNSATYSNVSQWWEAHRDFSLSTWISAFEGLLSSLMPSGTEVEVNLDAFEQPPFAERMSSYEVAIRAGVLTVDEARAKEGLSPIPPQETNPLFVNTVEPVPVTQPTEEGADNAA